jgi:hypothetical protein
VNYRYIIFLFFIFGLGFFNKSTAAFNVSSSVPSNGSINYGRLPQYFLDFPVNACANLGGSVTIRKKGSMVAETIDPNSYVGNCSPQISFTASQLDANTCYILTVNAGAFTNNGSYLDQNNQYQAEFCTGTCLDSTICPECIVAESANILHLSPPNSAVFVQKNQSLNIIFDRNVTKNSGSFILKKYSDNSILETIPVTSSQVTGWGTSQIIINPSINFLDGTQYYMNMDFKDHRLETEKNNWTFTIQKLPSVFSGSGL